ncbi:MAG: hypothetical protein VYD53_00695 [Pseudomonadota bacterium]|nr:hypothetical protein [Pseudomonadota bacterium]
MVIIYLPLLKGCTAFLLIIAYGEGTIKRLQGKHVSPLLDPNIGLVSQERPVYLMVSLIANGLYMLLNSNRRVPANDTPVANL